VFGQPWRPLTAEEQAVYDADSAWLLATADRVERGEVSEEEGDAIEARVKRLGLRDDAEREKMRTASEAMEGGGTDHGRPPTGSRCGCGACERWRRANDVAHPAAPERVWRSPEHLALWRADDEERAAQSLALERRLGLRPEAET
jgi:hypothetical protein